MAKLEAPGVVPTWTLTDRLRKAREAADLSQARLGELLGIGRTTVTNYETAVTIPRRAVLLAWAMATDVDSTWLEHGLAVMPGPDGESAPAPGLEPGTLWFADTERLAVAA